jgi:subtilisin family serine protease
MAKNYIKTPFLANGITAMLCATLILTGCTKESNIVSQSADDAKPQARMAAPANTVPNELLVKFRSGTSDAARQRAFQGISASVKEHIVTKAMRRSGDYEGIFLLHSPVEAEQAISRIKLLKEVEIAEPNYIYTYGSISNDPYYTGGSLWGMYGLGTTPANQYGIGATTAWANNHTGSSSVIVGIIDEGVMNTHPDLAANCWVNPFDPIDGIDNDNNGYADDKYGWDFVNNDNSPYDSPSDDHATHVAGTIGAVGGNGIGVAGVCWDIQMISCKFLGKNGGTTANAIKAVDYITDLKIDHSMNIVATNNSWGGGGSSSLLQAAIERANAADILFIAAAGNNGTNNDVTASYPSNYPNANVIAVASVTSTGGLSSFSNYGATKVDLGAPGSGIYSTIPHKNGTPSYASYSGTSMATPHVTGAVALYASTHPGLSAAALKSAILGTVTATTSLNNKCSTGGRLNVSTY